MPTQTETLFLDSDYSFIKTNGNEWAKTFGMKIYCRKLILSGKRLIYINIEQSKRIEISTSYKGIPSLRERVLGWKRILGESVAEAMAMAFAQL
ncbi:hypothetical protein RO3G_15782 [Rhizopus delemar RA 99-880]|uniref:Uncharacterized protein n=1 Tax=Rhizopus delemar (strain RA 99-880 / ATCC MYA-4621 / FGSC 9543 / NRRL 43880) TaxID=246409 RepID=I1CRJ1_RHIO9|nr:hypothetical protein RO3G_15782 [Rhizopus delemar RA 99-880]|eukprot:EIE91071.1 hypothetical protein RO3G_15782 [Rhizopus delemar RA 99-880]